MSATADASWARPQCLDCGRWVTRKGALCKHHRRRHANRSLREHRERQRKENLTAYRAREAAYMKAYRKRRRLGTTARCAIHVRAHLPCRVCIEAMVLLARDIGARVEPRVCAIHEGQQVPCATCSRIGAAIDRDLRAELVAIGARTLASKSLEHRARTAAMGREHGVEWRFGCLRRSA